MQRDSRAYLSDILEAAAAIQAATVGITIETYSSNRLIRSAVEREFITIIDFRNQLTHEYPNISDLIVWGCIQVDLPLLANHCLHELNQLNQNPS